MDRKRSVLAGFMALFLLGAGSASVLSSFGSISGTVDVRPALEITAVGNYSDTEATYVNMTNQASEPIAISRVGISDSESGFDPLNSSATDEIASGKKVVVTSMEVSASNVTSWFGTDVLHLTTDSSTLGGAMNQGGDTARVKIDDTVVDSFSYGGSQ